ncbi:PREDICTED: uncharacterized protein LOC106315309 [Brassica oleracea var. oleracea]|uniref:uncharacterized protein LOC106315309 n=1 Tax=Brassica oleracea var. oleracea TaxID=109376 RepID=UPI0006A7553C|nr:PREDICTED: uncharacterized protein LOC106315309 [Brassica oleracea var. oleracea]
MTDDEPIDGFISKISELASEASVLGKKYDEKDLVKKLLRCLPPRFEAYKAVLDIAVNTDEMKFDQLSGILKVHDLEKSNRTTNSQKSIAFVSDSNEQDRVTKIEENLGLMARNFNKFIKRMDKGGNRSNSRFQRNNSDQSNSQNTRQDSKNSKKKELKCHECEGYGHFRNECPLAKRKELKCIDCKGFGHTRSECPNNLKKDKSLMCFSDTESESDSDRDELHLNFMALVSKEEEPKLDSGVEEDEDDLNNDLESEYKSLFDKFAELSHENLQLLKDKAMLKAQVNILELEKPSEQATELSILKNSDQELLSLKRAMTEQERVQKQFELKMNCLNDPLTKEMDKSKLLENQLAENLKKVRMLTTGTTTLDQLLTIGQCPSSNWGLGFQGGTSKSAEETVFVKGSSNEKEIQTTTKVQINNQKGENLKKTAATRRGNGCHFCGKRGHNVRVCFFRKIQYQRAWRMNLCFMEPSLYGHVWIAKKDLYPNYKQRALTVAHSEKSEIRTNAEQPIICNFATLSIGTELVSNVAYTSSDSNSQFDTPLDFFEKLEFIKGGKVTFGDGGQGKIRGVGELDRSVLPKLVNVFYVDGLKANLISVSQLCDEGLENIFNSKECRAVDAKGNVVLCGVRSGNNCYMWKPSHLCYSAKESKLDLWHKKLGHMNTNGLTRLINSQVVRGIPELEKQTDTVCGGCCQDQQARVTQKIECVTPPAEASSDVRVKEESEEEDE